MLTLKQMIATIDRQEEARILLAGLEFRIFSVLDKKGLTIREICSKAGMISDGGESLLNALVAMGALRKKGALFYNTSETYKYFCESSKDYKKGTIMLLKSHRDEWEGLIQSLRHGRNLSDFEDGDDPNFRHLFTYAMHERSLQISGKIAGFVCRKPIGRLLDLGAGPGSYSAAMLKKDKAGHATLLDRPAALWVAKEIISGMKLEKRVKFLKGDLFETTYEKGYDTVFFSNILHIYDEKENTLLLKKIKNSLNTGGRLILVDFFLDDNRTAPYDAALFSLTMLLYTATGKTYTLKETKALLKKSGFHRFKSFNLERGSAVLQAVKK